MRKFNLKFNPKRRGKGGTGQGISRPVLPNPLCSGSRMGHGLGQGGEAKINTKKKLRKAKENRRIHKNPTAIGGDYWTRTSDLLRVKQAL